MNGVNKATAFLDLARCELEDAAARLLDGQCDRDCEGFADYLYRKSMDVEELAAQLSEELQKFHDIEPKDKG